MLSDPFVAYLHTGLSGDGRTGTPLAAQRAAVARYRRGRGPLAAEIVETGEEGQGLIGPRLREALSLCRRHGATLLMADLSAFGEDAAFLHHLSAELRRLDLRFAAADRPEASEVTLGIMAALAEIEDRWSVSRSPEMVARRHAFYARITAEGRALPTAGKGAAATAATVRPRASSAGCGRAASGLGASGLAVSAQRSRRRAEEVAPILSEIRAAGALTLEQVANALNALGVPSARGNRWYPMQVTRVEKRLAAEGPATRPTPPSFAHSLHA
ncbi:recombinase family protein [Methylorubrum aminovorans]